MFEKVQALRERLQKESGQEVSALDLEKVAYVLGKEAQPGSKRYLVAEEQEEGDKAEEAPKSSRKRKGAATKDKKTDEEADQQPEAKKSKRGTRT